MALGEDGADTGADAGGAADLLGADAGAQGGGADKGGAGDKDGADKGGDKGGGEGGAAPDWFEKLSAAAGEGDATSNRDWAAAKGLKDLDGLVKIARDTEKAFREGGKIKVPGEGAKPEEIAAYKAAIGVPEKVEDYEIKPIANGSFDPTRAEGPDNPKNLPLNEPLIGALRESALKHGAPKAAFEGLVSDFVKLQLDEAAAEKKAQDDQVAEKLKEWGGKKAENSAHIDAAARALGLSRQDLNWFRGMPGGAGRALDLMVKLGSGMAEDTLITGGKGRFGVSGAEAQAEIDRLKTDAEFQKKVRVVGSPERARWDRLNAAQAEWKSRDDQQA